MILKKIIPEIFDSLDWFDTVYILENHINNPNETPKKSQIQPFFEVKNNLDLFYGNYYFSNAMNYSYNSDVK